MTFKKGHSGNRAGRPPKASASVQPSGDLRFDGWGSTITGIGHALFDKRMSAEFIVEQVSDEEAQAIYRGDDMGAKAVDIWPTHMLREGFDLSITEMEAKGAMGDENEEGAEPTDKLNGKVNPEKEEEPPAKRTRQDNRLRLRRDAKDRARKLRTDAAADKLKDLSERAMKKFRKLKGKQRFKEALAYARAYGGGAILVGARDGSKDWAQPLKLEAVTGGKQRGIDFLTSLEARELSPYSYYDNPQEDKYGEVKIWQVTTTPKGRDVEKPTEVKPVLVHESRLIIFQGIIVSRNQVSTRPGWGDSIFTRVKPVLRDFNMSWNSAAIIMHEFSLASMKIKDLILNVNAGPEGMKKILARMAAVQLGRSTAKLTLLDDGEEVKREFANVSGLADMLEKFMERLAAALDVPVELLMGMAPAGLNATGDASIRNFFDKVKASQIDDLEPELHRVFELILRALNNGKEPAKWGINFKPLWQESPKEKAETTKTVIETSLAAIEGGLITQQEARQSHFGGEKFCADITIDDAGSAFGPGDVDAYAKSAAAPANGNAPAPAPAKLGPDGKPLEAEKPKLGPDGKPLPVDPAAAPKPVEPKLGPDGKPLPPELGPDGNPVAPKQESTAGVGEQIPISAPEKPISNAGLNGAQITSMMDVAKMVAAGEIARLSGKTILLISFPITPEQAEGVLGPEDFQAVKPPAPAFGGGGGFGAKPSEEGDKPEPPKPGGKPPMPPKEAP